VVYEGLLKYSQVVINAIELLGDRFSIGVLWGYCCVAWLCVRPVYTIWWATAVLHGSVCVRCITFSGLLLCCMALCASGVYRLVGYCCVAWLCVRPVYNVWWATAVFHGSVCVRCIQFGGLLLCCMAELLLCCMALCASGVYSLVGYCCVACLSYCCVAWLCLRPVYTI
jgi:hypothetical protein